MAEEACRLIPKAPRLSEKVPAELDAEIEWAPNGKSVAFQIPQKDKRESIICGNWKSKAHELITARSLRHGGPPVVYIARDDKKSRVVVGDQEGPLFDDVEIPSVREGAKSIAYRAKRGDREYVVSNDHTYGPFEDVVGPYLSPDGGEVG